MANSETSHNSNARILIVDDMAVNRTILSSMLTTIGVSCDLAESGQECLDLCRNNSYDLILLDHRMPDMDGVDTLVRLKEIFHRTGVETPVICHTADEGKNYINLYKAAGFADVLIKPADPGKLMVLLMTYLPDGGFTIPADEEKKKHLSDELASLPVWLKNVSGLDLTSGIEHCDTASDYLDALRVFTGSIKDKAADIERFEREENWPMYLLRVHSLKSVARLIGAISVADKAADLEYAGMQQEYGLVHALTRPLLDEYTGMLPKLKKLLSRKGIEEDPAETPVSEKKANTPPMERAILFINDEDGIVARGIVKALKGEDFKVITVKDIPEVILNHQAESSLLLYYPTGDIDHIKVVSTMLAEMCRDDNKILCLAGDPIDIEAASSIHDKDCITAVYPRPINLNKLAADMSGYYDIKTENKRTRTILVIDDDPDFLRIMEKWLSASYQVDCTHSGASALAYLDQKRPDLILLDYEMPGMNGNQVMQRIRSNLPTTAFPSFF
ncbi:MAG: response regulator [Lachnospiraceae bacterium]|nr:response regulator [Lachnospiraceae bacterium]